MSETGSGLTVALGPWGRSQGGGGSAMNPLSMLSDVMQLRQQQQKFNAQQVLGQSLAGSSTPEEGMQRFIQSGLAGFYPEGLTTLRQASLLGAQTTEAQAQAARSQYALGGDVFGGLVHVGAISSTPEDYERNFNLFKGMLPDTIKNNPNIQSLMEDVHTSYIGGLADPSNPDARQQAYQQRWLAHNAAVASPEMLRNVIGTPIQVPTPAGTMGAVQLPTGEIRVAGGAPVGIGPTQQAYLHDRGTDMAAYQKELDNSVLSGSGLMQTLQEARGAMDAVRTGGGESVRVRLGQLGQAVGASPELISKIVGGDLGAAQEFQKLTAQMAMGQVRQQIPPGSRLNRQEWESFERNNPQIDTDPNAVNKIFNFWTRLYVRDRIEQREMNNYLDRGGQISRWPAEWQQKAQQMGLVNPQFGVRGGNPVSPQAVNALLDNPDRAAEFDAKYGRGSSAAFLGLTQGQ